VRNCRRAAFIEYSGRRRLTHALTFSLSLQGPILSCAPCEGKPEECPSFLFSSRGHLLSPPPCRFGFPAQGSTFPSPVNRLSKRSHLFPFWRVPWRRNLSLFEILTFCCNPAVPLFPSRIWYCFSLLRVTAFFRCPRSIWCRYLVGRFPSSLIVFLFLGFSIVWYFPHTHRSVSLQG